MTCARCLSRRLPVRISSPMISAPMAASWSFFDIRDVELSAAGASRGDGPAGLGFARRATRPGFDDSRRCGFLAELLVQLSEHAREGAVDQRLGFDQARTVGAEALGQLLGGHRQSLLSLAVGEEIRAAQRAHPRQLGECELAILALELHPDAALERARDLEIFVVEDLPLGLRR